MKNVNKSDILQVVFVPGSAETNVKWGGKLSDYLMTSCVKNIPTKNYQILITFYVTVENVGDAFLGHSV